MIKNQIQIAIVCQTFCM